MSENHVSCTFDELHFSYLFERDTADDKDHDDARGRELLLRAGCTADATAARSKAKATEAALEQVDAGTRELLRGVHDLIIGQAARSYQALVPAISSP